MLPFALVLDFKPAPDPPTPRSNRTSQLGWGEKPHLLSRSPSLCLHPPVERKTAQRKLLHLLSGTQPHASPNHMGQGRGAPSWRVEGIDVKKNLYLPRSFPQCGEEKQIQGQGHGRVGENGHLSPWESLQICHGENSERCLA